MMRAVLGVLLWLAVAAGVAGVAFFAVAAIHDHALIRDQFACFDTKLPEAAAEHVASGRVPVVGLASTLNSVPRDQVGAAAEQGYREISTEAYARATAAKRCGMERLLPYGKGPTDVTASGTWVAHEPAEEWTPAVYGGATFAPALVLALVRRLLRRRRATP